MTDTTSSGGVSAVPNVPDSSVATNNNGVKIATKDLMLYKPDDLEVQVMKDVLFEQIASQELISISRNDIVNGQDIKVQPIKNLKSLGLKYGPKNIINVPDTSYYYFNNFAISLENYLPDQESGVNLAEIDEAGNIVINLINLSESEQIEVQVVSDGKVFDDTFFDGTIGQGES
jgi:hypothetical protein